MRILYVSTISNTINAFMVPHIKMLLKMGHKVDIACSVKNKIDLSLIDAGCKVFDISFSRSVIDKSNVFAFSEFKKLLKDNHYDVVHTHTPIASMIVRLACRKKSEIKVIYTAHGFHFFKGAPIKNWLIYYPIEKIISKYTDILVTINSEDYIRGSKLKMKNLAYTHGVGIDVEKINMTNINKIEKRKELGIPESAFLILSVGELNKNKNHQIVIRALSDLKKKEIHYIICGQGPLKEKLEKLSKQLGLESQIHLLGFRSDIIEICKTSDLFTFPSKREGLPVSVMEAMASGLPIIATRIRGNEDLIKENKGGYLVNPLDVGSFVRSISELYNSEILRGKFSKFNKIEVQKYSLEKVLLELESIYELL